MLSSSIQFKRRTLSVISDLWSRCTKIQPKNRGFRVLLYHSVDKDMPGDTYGMNVTPEEFRSQMRFLQTMDGIDVVSLSAAVQTAGLDDNLRVVITFDDGFRNNLYNAAPVLLEFGFPFVVFVTVDYLSSLDQRYLNPAELRELSELSGASIGSHGMTHRALTCLSMENISSELVVSKETLEQITGKKLTAISYPHGQCNQQVKTAATRADYHIGAGSQFGANTPGTDVMSLRRTEIWATDSKEDMGRKINGSWDWYAVYQRLRGL